MRRSVTGRRCGVRVTAALAALAASLMACWGGAALAFPATPEQIFNSVASEGLNDKTELVEAIAKFERRDAQGAMELLKTASEKYPELPPARALLARLFFAVGQIPVGQALLEELAAESPDDPEAYIMLGDLAFAGRRTAEATLLYGKAGDLAAVFKGNEKRKINVESRFHAGMTSVSESRRAWEAARDHLQAWLKIDPENALAHHRLGVVLYQLKPDAPQDAVKELELATRKTDKLPPYQVTMCRLCEQAGKREDARKWADFAIEKNPDNMQTRLGVSRWAWETDQLDIAKKHADAATELDANALEAKIMRGVVARFQANLEEAEKYLDDAKLQDPANFTATDQLALVLVENKDDAKRRRALELAEINVRNNPQSFEAAWTLGWIYYRWGRLNDAAKLMQAAAATGQLTADMAYYLACLYKELGQPERVRQFLDAALASKGPFAYRTAAKKMQDEVTKAAASAAPPAAPAAAPAANK